MNKKSMIIAASSIITIVAGSIIARRVMRERVKRDITVQLMEAMRIAQARSMNGSDAKFKTAANGTLSDVANAAREALNTMCEDAEGDVGGYFTAIDNIDGTAQVTINISAKTAESINDEFFGQVDELVAEAVDHPDNLDGILSRMPAIENSVVPGFSGSFGKLTLENSARLWYIDNIMGAIFYGRATHKDGTSMTLVLKKGASGKYTIDQFV